MADHIDEVYLFIDVEAGTEGVPAVMLKQDGRPVWMPLFGADKTRVDHLRQYAQALVAATGRPLKLVRYTQREELEVINPVDIN